jgi:hypothetical protein
MFLMRLFRPARISVCVVVYLGIYYKMQKGSEDFVFFQQSTSKMVVMTLVTKI